MRLAICSNDIPYKWKNATEHLAILEWCDLQDIDIGFNLYGIWIPDPEEYILFKMRWE